MGMFSISRQALEATKIKNDGVDAMSNIYQDGVYWKLKGNETMHEEDSEYKVENALSWD